MEGFHSQDGLWFKRNEDGSVTIRKVIFGPDRVTMEQTLPANIWGSVIASMSKRGETDLRWYEAMKFHNE